MTDDMMNLRDFVEKTDTRQPTMRRAKASITKAT